MTKKILNAPLPLDGKPRSTRQMAIELGCVSADGRPSGQARECIEQTLQGGLRKFWELLRAKHGDSVAAVSLFKFCARADCDPPKWAARIFRWHRAAIIEACG